MRVRDSLSRKRQDILEKRTLALTPQGSRRETAVRQAGGQATKGTRWMPWRQEAKKDVVSCDKLRGAASRRRCADVRMGKPSPSHVGEARF
jgi:hypothetical protein